MVQGRSINALLPLTTRRISSKVMSLDIEVMERSFDGGSGELRED